MLQLILKLEKRPSETTGCPIEWLTQLLPNYGQMTATKMTGWMGLPSIGRPHTP